MNKVNELTSLEMVEQFLKDHAMSFLFVSRPECSVCHSLLPKLRDLLERYPQIHLGHIDASKVEEVAEKFLIFTAPVMLLMIDQKEYLREDRFVRFGRLQEQLDRIYEGHSL